MNEQELLTIQEAADFLDQTHTQVYEMILNKEIQFEKKEDTYLIPKRQFEEDNDSTVNQPKRRIVGRIDDLIDFLG